MSTIAEIQNRLSSAFSKDPDSNVAKLIEVIAAELDEFETAALDVLDSHQLEHATGVHLDRVVDLIGISRLPGESDAAFRTRASIERWLQSSSGTKAELEAIVCYITGLTTDDFEIQENPNAVGGTGAGWGLQKWGSSRWGGSYQVGQFRIVFDTSPSAEVLAKLNDAIDKARAAGVLFLTS